MSPDPNRARLLNALVCLLQALRLTESAHTRVQGMRALDATIAKLRPDRAPEIQDLLRAVDALRNRAQLSFSHGEPASEEFNATVNRAQLIIGPSITGACNSPV